MKRINTSEKQINTNSSLGIQHKKTINPEHFDFRAARWVRFFILVPELIFLCKWLLFRKVR